MLWFAMAKSGAKLIRYLTSSETDDGWQIGCVDVGHVAVAPGAPYPVLGEHPPGYAETLREGRTLSEYQLLCISEGQGSLTVGKKVYPVQAGTAFLLFPGVTHTYAPDPATGWTEYWVGFRGVLPDLLVKKGFFSPDDPVYPGAFDPSAVNDFRQLLDEVAAEPPGYRLVAASRVVLLLSRLVAARRAQNIPDGTSEIVGKAKLVFEEHLTDHDVDLADLARKLGLSYVAFTSLFRQYTGQTPHQYWLNLKINHGKGWLVSGKSVKETAFHLGFESEFHFSRLFKKKTGTPPSRWGR
ncbi:MAG: AraC family transcriptional regulator [Spirochaetales bacterium]